MLNIFKMTYTIAIQIGLRPRLSRTRSRASPPHANWLRQAPITPVCLWLHVAARATELPRRSSHRAAGAAKPPEPPSRQASRLSRKQAASHRDDDRREERRCDNNDRRHDDKPEKLEG